MALVKQVSEKRETTENGTVADVTLVDGSSVFWIELTRFRKAVTAAISKLDGVTVGGGIAQR